MKHDQNSLASLKNETKIQLIRKRKEYEFIICCNNAILGCLLARTLSDKGSSVAIINKATEPTGFDAIYSSSEFIIFLAKELGVEIGKGSDKKQIIATIFKYAQNPEKIDYFGENYRINDIGYDGEKNFFYVDRSRIREATDDDNLVYKSCKPIDGWMSTLLPRNLKKRQLVGSGLIVTCWHQFMHGWTGEYQGTTYKYITHRPNTIMLFGANLLRQNTMREDEAKNFLNEEILRAAKIIKEV